MLEAALWGLAAGSGLIIGSVAGVALDLPRRPVALLLGFGAGALISGLAFQLAGAAFEEAGGLVMVIGLTAGSFAFYAGNRLVKRMGGRHGRRGGGRRARGEVVMLGVVLDAVPEAFVLGALLLSGEGMLAFAVAIFVANMPEALTSARDLRREGYRHRWILLIWLGVALATAGATAIGFAFLSGMGDLAVSIAKSFAAGAIIVVLADAIMPEAFEEGGDVVGLATTAGFAATFLLAQAR